jgi:hypothetical protein
MLKAFLDLNPFTAPDCIIGAPEHGDAESYPSMMSVIKLAIKSSEEMDQEPALSFASQHN